MSGEAQDESWGGMASLGLDHQRMAELVGKFNHGWPLPKFSKSDYGLYELISSDTIGDSSLGGRYAVAKQSEAYPQQDSIAIAKKTARCAQHMGPLKSFQSPHYAPGYFSRNL